MNFHSFDSYIKCPLSTGRERLIYRTCHTYPDKTITLDSLAGCLTERTFDPWPSARCLWNPPGGSQPTHNIDPLMAINWHVCFPWQPVNHIISCSRRRLSKEGKAGQLGQRSQRSFQWSWAGFLMMIWPQWISMNYSRQQVDYCD